MSITKRNYLLQITLLTFLVGVIGGWGYYSAFPHHYFNGYPLIPVFYFVFGVFIINMVEMGRRKMPKHLLQLYLLIRVVRMIVSILVMLLYCIVVREEAKCFLLTFIANYIIYLIYDSWFFFSYEMNRKQRKNGKQDGTVA